MGSQIHWFPGHMNKALHEIQERVKMIDLVIEVLDSRAPISSINPQLEEATKNKKKLIILSKPDLADPILTKKWAEYLKSKYGYVITANLTSPSILGQLTNAVKTLGKEKWAKDMSKGMKPQPLRTMILGIPNVGKSSLINRLANRKAAGVQNKPGYTRGEQWIKVNNDFLLLDTPGILPMNYDDKKKSINLALIGAIREDILPNTDLVNHLLSFLKSHYPNALQSRFSIESIDDTENVLQKICDVRKIINSNGQCDFSRAETVLLKEFKDGLLGQITLDEIA